MALAFRVGGLGLRNWMAGGIDRLRFLPVEEWGRLDVILSRHGVGKPLRLPSTSLT